MAQAAVSFHGLPNHLIQNPLWILMTPCMVGWRVLWWCKNVIAVRVLLQLPDQGAYDLAVYYRSEGRTKDAHEQVAAARRATSFLDHELLLPELFSCRVRGQGVVIVSMYGGEDLKTLLSDNRSELMHSLPTLKEKEDFLKQLVAQLLVASDHLHSRKGKTSGVASGDGQCFGDLKPSNIVIDLSNMKARVIDFEVMMSQNCSNVFTGVSDDHFPVDYAAVDPDTQQPYCCDDVSGYQKISLAVAASKACSVDSNLVGITALRVLSRFTYKTLLPVKFADSKYNITVAEEAALDQEQLQQLRQSRKAAFAAEYREYMSDRKALSESLTATGISQAAVEFLLALLEVDPDKRPSIKDAMSMTWVEDAVNEIKRQLEVRVIKFMYWIEQRRYRRLPGALQQATSHQQQQLRERQQQQEQQLAATRRALQVALRKIKEKQQRVEQLEQQVLMLQVQLQEAATAASGQLQVAGGATSAADAGVTRADGGQ